MKTATVKSMPRGKPERVLVVQGSTKMTVMCEPVLEDHYTWAGYAGMPVPPMRPVLKADGTPVFVKQDGQAAPTMKFDSKPDDPHYQKDLRLWRRRRRTFTIRHGMIGIVNEATDTAETIEWDTDPDQGKPEDYDVIGEELKRFGLSGDAMVYLHNRIESMGEADVIAPDDAENPSSPQPGPTTEAQSGHGQADEPGSTSSS